MPRTITITFADGGSHVYEGVPDTVSPDQVEARAAAEFAGRKLVHIDGGKGGAIPGAEGEDARRAVVKANEPGFMDKAKGAIEAGLATGTGLVGGAIGSIGGAVGAGAAAILDGSFGTKQAANMIEQAAGEGAQKLTYAPRSELGQEYTQAVGDAMQNLAPVAAVLPGMAPVASRGAGPAGVIARAGIEGAARDVAGAPGAAAASGAIDAAVKAASMGKEATTLPRRALEALQREKAPTPGTMGSVGAAGTDVAAMRRTNAEALPVPIQLTKGQASRDAAQLKFEAETAKNPELGAPLRDRLIAQNQAILENFDHWADQTGAQAPTLRATGSAVDQALVAQAKAAKAEINAKYAKARAAGEMEAPVNLNAVIDHLNAAAPEATTAPLLKTVRDTAIKLGIAEDRGGVLVPASKPEPYSTLTNSPRQSGVTLNLAEQFRQAINRSTDYEPTNIRQATILKGLIDEATAGKGGDLYKSARAARTRYAQKYEDRAVISKLLNEKQGTSDRQVALEDVHKHAILDGSLDDVRVVRRVLQTGGEEGMQAWRELQGATLRHIRDEATKSVALDSRGNRVISPAALDKTITALDKDGKLDFIFGKKGAQQLRDLRELAQIAKTVPPESAVNHSNTAATLAAFADVAFTGFTGTPAPIATVARLGIKELKNAALKKRINEALSQAEAKQAPGRKRFKAPPIDPTGEIPPATFH